jgi:hypothetical protein
MNKPLFTNVIQVGLVVRCAATTARRYQELLGLSDWHFNEVDTESGKGANFPAPTSLSWPGPILPGFNSEMSSWN